MSPKPHPAWNLRVAAIEFAADVEDRPRGEHRRGWDRLRKAAARYVDAEKRRGRPSMTGKGE